MPPVPGPFAPTVTQWVYSPADPPATDAYGNEVPAFTSRSVRALASFPGNSLEATAAGDVVTADAVLVLNPEVSCSALDEWTVAGIRYRALGAPGRYVSPFTGTAVTQVNLRRIF